MKHRFLPMLLILALFMFMVLPAYAASSPTFTVINENKRLSSERTFSATAKSAEEIMKILNGTINAPPYRIFGNQNNLDMTSPVVIKMLNTDSTVFDRDFTVEDRICRISLTSSANTANMHYTHNVTCLLYTSRCV